VTYLKVTCVHKLHLHHLRLLDNITLTAAGKYKQKPVIFAVRGIARSWTWGRPRPEGSKTNVEGPSYANMYLENNSL